jgi:tetratricopeptide (TPR) repeat protein
MTRGSRFHQDQEPQPKGGGLSRVEALVLIPNLVLLGVVVLFLLAVKSSPERVAPLVEADRDTTRRITNLEARLRRDPGNMESALELARIYRNVGEFPWSYNALRAAERSRPHEPSWQLMLGLAYLELGKNEDSVRVLERAQERCQQQGCPPRIAGRIDIFARVAQLFEKRQIDARNHHAAAEKALHEVLKPVVVDPDEMRPKAPVEPQEEGAGPPPSGS